MEVRAPRVNDRRVDDDGERQRFTSRIPAAVHAAFAEGGRGAAAAVSAGAVDGRLAGGAAGAARRGPGAGVRFVDGVDTSSVTMSARLSGVDLDSGYTYVGDEGYIDFGDDTSEYAREGECDDSRFCDGDGTARKPSAGFVSPLNKATPTRTEHWTVCDEGRREREESFCQEKR